MFLRYKKLSSRASDPIRGTDQSAGLDLVAITKEIKTNNGTKTITYGTGLAFEIPEGYAGLLFPRSSVSKTNLSLANSVGVIDSDYRGEIKAVFNVDNEVLDDYEIGDRVCQLVIMPVLMCELVNTDDLSDTVRGTGGFGSTGK